MRQSAPDEFVSGNALVHAKPRSPERFRLLGFFLPQKLPSPCIFSRSAAEHKSAVLETFSANGGYGMQRKRTVGRWTIRLALASALLLAGMTAAVSGAAGPEQPGGGNTNGAGDGATKAAFIRNQNLWVESGGQERQLTEGDKAHKPLWSADGQWIA
jgi:hypothetical protein